MPSLQTLLLAHAYYCHLCFNKINIEAYVSDFTLAPKVPVETITQEWNICTRRSSELSGPNLSPHMYLHLLGSKSALRGYHLKQGLTLIGRAIKETFIYYARIKLSRNPPTLCRNSAEIRTFERTQKYSI